MTWSLYVSLPLQNAHTDTHTYHWDDPCPESVLLTGPLDQEIDDMDLIFVIVHPNGSDVCVV